MVRFRGAFYGATIKEKPMLYLLIICTVVAVSYPYMLVGRWLAWAGMCEALQVQATRWGSLPSGFRLMHFMLFPVSAALNDEPSFCPAIGANLSCGRCAAACTRDQYTKVMCVAWPIKVAVNALAITLCLIPYLVRCLAKRDGSRMTVATVS
jgi:hypothetical protein